MWGPGVRTRGCGGFPCGWWTCISCLGVSFFGFGLTWGLGLGGWSCIVLSGRGLPFFPTWLLLWNGCCLLLLTVWHGAVHFPKVRLILAVGKSVGFGSDRSADFPRLFTLVHGSVVPEPQLIPQNPKLSIVLYIFRTLRAKNLKSSFHLSFYVQYS